MSAEHVSRIGVTGGLFRNPIVPGAVNEGDHVAPPSVLTSVNTSKKLSILEPVGDCRILVRPNDALLGLSRTMTPAGKVPPDRLRDSISVSKKRVLPVSRLEWLL